MSEWPSSRRATLLSWVPGGRAGGNYSGCYDVWFKYRPQEQVYLDRTDWIRAGVISVCGIFAAITLDVMLNAVRASGSYDPSNDYATTDAFLRILDAAHPGILIDRALRDYPPDKLLLFIAPAKEGFNMQVFYSIAHLAYPRRISAVQCGERGRGASRVIERMPRSSEIGGLVFFETDPGPWASGGMQITPKLFLAPYRGTTPWESFCR